MTLQTSSNADPVPLGPEAPGPGAEDPFAWLEEVASTRAMDWVHARNADTCARFASSAQFSALRDQMRRLLDAQDRIAYVTKMGAHYYNFWRDAQHPRGLWRRTTPDDYRAQQPAWETVLDLDALAATEGESWVWKGAQCRYPDWQRCLVQLSRGGADALVVREFDIAAKAFVAEGFVLPEAKSDVRWAGPDSVLVATDFGADTLTEAGYPRLVKQWQRGTPLAAAQPVYAGQLTDVAVTAYVYQRGADRHEIVQRSPSFFTDEYWLRENGTLQRIDVPADARIDFFGAQLLVQLRSDWETGATRHAAGSLLAIGLEAFRAGRRDFAVLFVPGERTALESYIATRSHLVLCVLDNVQSRLIEWAWDESRWSACPLAAPAVGSMGLAALDPDDSDAYFLTRVDFLTPDTLYLALAGSQHRELLKQRPAYFDATALHIEQWEAVSRDGTRVPYFIVRRRGTASDGSTPTLLYGYGGFEVSLTPWYSALLGKAWLEPGGIYVLANIRGGGEFGPRWHAAALQEKRQNAFDDFIAVAEDLVARGVTSPRRLGIMGGSNGGLLVGVMLTQRPELFAAVVCQVPLLDMRRYRHLLAGASWIGEYGDPDDPRQWAWLQRYSPYHQVRAGQRYPSVLFTTSTRDDRVHPAHARKMMARLQALGVPGIWYYENTEGGHAGSADNAQAAFLSALEYTYLWSVLGRGDATDLPPA